MSYTKTIWNDDKAPFIEALNLNKMEQGIEDAHTAVESANEEIGNMNTALESVNAEIESINAELENVNKEIENIVSENNNDNAEQIAEINEKLGDTDISSIGDGTVTGAIRNLAENPVTADPSVWISQAGYDALSDEEKDSDTQYFIYDSGEMGNAYTVPFQSDKYVSENVGDALNEVNENLAPLQTILNGTTTSSGNVVFQDFSENNVIIEARILDATYRKLDILKANGYGTAFTIFDIEGNRLANFDISIKVTYYPSTLFN
jgi:hypothetical protein